MGLQTFNGEGPQLLWRAVSRAARGEVSGITNHLNYCVIFIVCT